MNKKFLINYLICLLLLCGCSEKPLSEKQKAINAYKEKQRMLNITSLQAAETNNDSKESVIPPLAEEEIPLTFYKRGIEYASQGRFREAEEQFNRVLGIYKFDVVSSDCLAMLEDVREGIIDKDYAIHLFKGEDYNINGEYQKAIIELQESTQIDSNLYYAYDILGALHFHLGEYQQAIFYCEKAVQIDPSSVRSYETLALARNALKQFQEAIAELQNALRINPNQVTLRVILGYVYFSMGQTERAIAEVSKAIEMNPYISYSYTTLGMIYFSLGEYQKAIDYNRKAIQINPGEDSAYIALGVDHLYLKQPYKAIPYFQRSIQLNPNLIGYNALGYAYFSLGQYKEAEEAFQKLKELSQNRGNDKMADKAEEYLMKIREITVD